jgi:hypothetical protein
MPSAGQSLAARHAGPWLQSAAEQTHALAGNPLQLATAPLVATSTQQKVPPSLVGASGWTVQPARSAPAQTTLKKTSCARICTSERQHAQLPCQRQRRDARAPSPRGSRISAIAAAGIHRRAAHRGRMARVD